MTQITEAVVAQETTTRQDTPMQIRRPLNASALGELLVTASRRYRNSGGARHNLPAGGRGGAAPVPAAVELQELCPAWLRLIVDNDGG